MFRLWRGWCNIKTLSGLAISCGSIFCSYYHREEGFGLCIGYRNSQLADWTFEIDPARQIVDKHWQCSCPDCSWDEVQRYGALNLRSMDAHLPELLSNECSPFRSLFGCTVRNKHLERVESPGYWQRSADFDLSYMVNRTSCIWAQWLFREIARESIFHTGRPFQREWEDVALAFSCIVKSCTQARDLLR